MNHRKICLIALLVAFWPVWVWYFQRTIDGSDEPLGVVALLTVLVLVLFKKKYSTRTESLNSLNTCTVLVLIYCLCWSWTPKIVHALFAVSTIGLYATLVLHTVKLAVGDWMLLVLSLPIVASLNFYIGFPLRLLVCSLATPLITMSGIPSIAQGTAILWNDGGHAVYVDAPCSGIKMLWTSTYLSAILASLFDLKFERSITLFCVSMVVALAANVIRVTALFYIETGILSIPAFLHDFVHQGVGILSFIILALLTLLASVWLRTYKQVDNRLSGDVDWEGPSHLDKTAFVGSVIAKIKLRFHPSLLIFCMVSVIAAILPFLPETLGAEQSAHQESFSGWPSTLEGRSLKALPLPSVQERFAHEFPGKIGVFTDGACTIVMRWVNKPTRQLHSASDCYRGLGYTIKWLPLYVDGKKRHWSVFEAKRGNERLMVREMIFDTNGKTWNDVSAWYWASLLRQTSSPWWNVIIAEHVMPHG